jgi:hypothetical protein
MEYTFSFIKKKEKENNVIRKKKFLNTCIVLLISSVGIIYSFNRKN